MSRCTVDRCDEEVEKKDHTLCYAHWKAQKAGALGVCHACGRLLGDDKPLCLACFKAKKAMLEAPQPELREAGQGAREKADALASKHPVRSLLSKLTGNLIESPDYSWRVGADAEEAVGRELERLPRSWFVRHDLMLKANWNADHVVIGPPGAFVLDTKYRSGDVRTTGKGIRIDGYKNDMAEGVRDQAREISRRLRVAANLRSWVQPVLVFDNEVRGHREPDGVHVVDLYELVEYLQEMPKELSAIELEKVGRALMDDRTWAP